MPRTELVGDSDRYVKAGSTVVLRCIIRGAIEPPSYIIWYHGSHQLLPDKQGVRIEMMKNINQPAEDPLTAIDGVANDIESTERQTIVSTASRAHRPQTASPKIVNCQSPSHSSHRHSRSFPSTGRHFAHRIGQETRLRQLHMQPIEQPTIDGHASRHQQ